jgi:ectoine hydroxylase-related dioxygenase (phytanoyl-CoA dioxygenase family)
MSDGWSAQALSSGSATSESLSHLRERFEAEGYLLFENVVGRDALAALSRAIIGRFRADTASGAMFVGGGNVSGHLNCYPGTGSRFVYEALEARGIFELAAALSPQPLRKPNIGCNLNLPGSKPQNEHVDGYAATPFLVVNVAAVDTDLTNGAMEIIPGSQRRAFKYWEIALRRADRRRLTMKQGDAVLRTSTLWHRGMPNQSASPRPMLAFTWEDGGSQQRDPYALHQGQITFLPNRYSTDWKGQLVERAFVTAPRLATVYRAARSLFERR